MIFDQVVHCLELFGRTMIIHFLCIIHFAQDDGKKQNVGCSQVSLCYYEYFV